MRLTIWLLGREVFTISTDADQTAEDTATDCTTYPVGFSPSPGDRRWTEHQLPEG